MIEPRVVHVKSPMESTFSGIIGGEAQVLITPTPPLTNRPVITRRWLMPTIEIPLHSRKYPGLVALIDEEDFELVNQYRWRPVKRKTGWHAYTGSKTCIYLHRLILSPSGELEGDHIDGNGLDNRRSNLRIVTESQNKMNQRLRSDNRSGFKGVSWSSQKRKWRVAINVDDKQLHLGFFSDPIEAAHAYDAGAREFFREYACVNFALSGERAA